MRIKKLRLSNLNSLLGEFVIDFTRPQFVEDGIFLICGPTGAGKSTILDAICLALYGQTPRLNTISKSSNEIMSRQAGECFAELTFWAGDSEYQAHFSHRKARGKADGALQQPQRELSKEGQILSTRIAEVDALIEEITGMDFKRFTRSMLLAQGSFAAFLQSGPAERAPILEQITGTGIYTEISLRVHERTGLEKEKLEEINLQMGALVIASEDEIKVLNDKVLQSRDLIGEKSQTLNQLRVALDWQNNLKNLNQKLNQAQDQVKITSENLIQFAPQVTILEQAKKAQRLEVDYQKWQGLLSDQAKEQHILSVHKQSLTQTELEEKQAKECLINAQMEHKTAENQNLALLDLIKKVRPLDEKIREIQTKIKDKSQTLEIKSETLKQLQKDITNLNQKIKDQTIQINAQEQYLKTNQADLILIENLNAYLQRKKSIDSLGQELETQKQKAQNLSTQMAALRQKEQEFQNTLQAKDLEIKQILTQIQNSSDEKTSLEPILWAQFQKMQQQLSEGQTTLIHYEEKEELLQNQVRLEITIKNLEDHRKSLKDQSPCPLCGSTHHPFVTDNLPNPEDTEIKLTELRNSLKSQRSHNQKLELSLARLKDLLPKQDAPSVIPDGSDQDLTTCLKRYQDLIDSLTRLHQNLLKAKNERETILLTQNQSQFELASLISSEQEAKTQLAQAAHNLESLQEKLLLELLPYGVQKLDLQTESNLVQRQKSYINAQNLKRETESDIQKNRAISKEKEEIQQALSQEIQDLHALLDGLNVELSHELSNRQSIFGDKNPDTELETSQNHLNKTRALETTNKEKHILVLNQIDKLRQQIRELGKTQGERQTEILKAELRFGDSLARLGLGTVENYLQCLRSFEEINQLEDQISGLKQTLAQAQAQFSALQAEIGDLEAKKPPVLEDDLKKIEPLEAEIGTLNQELGGILEKLREQAELKQKLAGIIKDQDRQKLVWQSWANLNSLIGSHDGKKFRNYAQGLTFEVMISHANQQLRQMSDRYTLIRSPMEPLDLFVRDDYQAGVIRSTKNLSGGESFIISLALALGLSCMSSHKIRLDSLFLDEGFGTLDENTLEVALDTLASLKQNGKLIGIISHVPILKERISTQIQVIPGPGGNSRVM